MPSGCSRSSASRCRPSWSRHCCRCGSASTCDCCRSAAGATAHSRTRFLPVVTLALPQVAIVAKLTAAAMREALEAPHIRTLRAFGLPGRVVAWHALRGALLPVLSYCGPAAAALLTGSIIVEDDLRPARYRPLLRRWRVGARLHIDDGHRHRRRRDGGRLQFARRSRLRRARPARALARTSSSRPAA